MAEDIGVVISAKGEDDFKKALGECQNSLKQLNSELKANSAEYKAHGKSVKDTADQAEYLKQEIEKQKRSIKDLGEAVAFAADKYGETSKETTKYVVAQNRARETLAKLEKELKDTDREMEELGRDSIRAGRQLEQGIGDGAKDAARGLDDMDEILGTLKTIAGLSAISVGVEFVKGTANMLDGVVQLVEGSEEFNRQLSYINQNAKDSGISMETVGKNLSFATAAIGNFDQAAEGVNNLLGSELNAKEFADATNLLVGAVISLPETFTFPALAEGLRETLQQKEAVGQFADMLSYLGVDLEAFNEAMKKTSTMDAAQDVLFSFVSNRGLEQKLHGWAQDNQDMIEAKQATFELNMAVGELAKTMAPLGTAWTDMKVAAIETITTFLEETQVDEWAVETIRMITEIIRLLNTAEGRAELVRRALGPEFGETYTLEEVLPEGVGETEREKAINALEQRIAEQKRVIEELRMSGDSVQLYGAELYLEEMEKELEVLKGAGTITGASMMDGFIVAIKDKTPEAERTLGAFADAANRKLASIAIPDLAGGLSNQMYAIEGILNRRPVYAYGPAMSGGTTGTGAGGARTINLNVNGMRVVSALYSDTDEFTGRMINMG